MSQQDRYTVGWICAIKTEYVAARAFLDEVHEGPEFRAINDNNDYTLGRIGKHNVVITILPKGEYGIATAAAAATNMLRSFTNIRIGLMVGLGGGAPSSKHDIRLGDVVVSTPGNGRGGVYQYDFGKAMQGQKFHELGILDQPPPILRAAVNGLEAQYEEDGHQLEETINNVLNAKPRLRKNYSRPSQISDRLYRSEVLHWPEGEYNCNACGDDELLLVTREERADDEDNPTIHYGLIASANTLIMDARVRDILIKQKDILCFEMEAAGLMNHFPCLVVRGICDYSDTHKNKDWQGYAAMTAAAYTKALLARIPPTQVDSEKRIQDMIYDLTGTVDEIAENTRSISQHLNDKADLDILNWLIPFDYGPQQSDYLAKREPGTGTWFLETKEFCDWSETPGRTLFCPGIPGAGKTVMTAVVVEHLQRKFRKDPNVGIAYLYCNFKRQDEQTVRHFFTSLLKQLAQALPTLPPEMRQHYSDHEKSNTQPGIHEVLDFLQSVIGKYSRVFIVVDALDEIQANDRRASLLEGLTKFQDKFKINIFATSRSDPETQARLKLKDVLEIRAAGKDVQAYLRSHASKLCDFVQLNPELLEKVINGIARSVDGMFLLAELHLNSLADKFSEARLLKAIQTLPSGANAYDHAYEQAMERINSQLPGFVELAHRVLTWITHAKRQLQTNELQHALAVDSNSTILDEKALPGADLMLKSCIGLVTIDQKSKVIRLVHYTTQQYFERARERWFPSAEKELAETCMAYLLIEIIGSFQLGDWASLHFKEKNLLVFKYPFYRYAANFWNEHIRHIQSKLSIKLLATEENLKASLYIRCGNQPPKWLDLVPGLPVTYLAAYFGLETLLQSLINDGANVNAVDDVGRTALWYALDGRQESMVELRLGIGAVDLNTQQISLQQTLLLKAVENGKINVVDLLLNAEKVDVNSQDTEGRTPLIAAVQHSRYHIIKHLMDRDEIQIDLSDSHNRTPLWHASQAGDWLSCQILLTRGKATPHLRDKSGQSPFFVAARGEHKLVIKLLATREDVDVNAQDQSGLSPLSYAVKCRRNDLFKLLIHIGRVEVDTRDEWGRTPISYATEDGNEAVFNLLVNTDGVDFSQKAANDRNLISYAAASGCTAIFNHLIDMAKTEIDSRDGYGRTPLMYAVNGGHKAIYDILIATGAVNVNAQDRAGSTPFSLAVAMNRDSIATDLLERIDVEGTFGSTAFWWTAEKGYDDVAMKYLNTKKVDLSIRNTRGYTPLEWAWRNKKVDYIRAILALGPPDPPFWIKLAQTQLPEYSMPKRKASLMNDGKQIDET
ncbi:putative ankyrin repeat protein [Paramyrothecium foliicola]|nr:putative ankyrin repeat protein [Paramyrothecium foliicola]